MKDPRGPLGGLQQPARQEGPQRALETEDRSVTQILQSILANIQEIIRSEVRLAKTEISEETAKALRAIAVLGAGLLFGMYALGFLLLSAVYGLAAVLPNWLAPLLVGTVVAIVAAALVVVGRNRLRLVNAKPQKTIDSVKEDVQWVKDRTK